jgi:hypothetical protein
MDKLQANLEPFKKPAWVTPNEAVRVSGIQRTMLYELIVAGKLKSIKAQGKRLISFASIEELQMKDLWSKAKGGAHTFPT